MTTTNSLLTTLAPLAKTYPSLHIGGIGWDYRTQETTVTFDAFLGDDHLPTTITTHTFDGYVEELFAATTEESHEMFGLFPDIS